MYSKTTAKATAMFLLLSVAAAAISACANVPESSQSTQEARSGSEFSRLMGTDWALVMVRSGPETVNIDRAKFAQEGINGDWFTIHFDDGRLNGVAAPNRYFGPYTTADGQALSIGLLGSTLMASFLELDELKEHEYYAYLQNVSRWDISGVNLELHTKNDSGADVALVFAPAR
jgi:heat shock protein HslJ